MMLDWHTDPTSGGTAAVGLYEGQWYEIRRGDGTWELLFRDSHVHELITATVASGEWPDMKVRAVEHATACHRPTSTRAIGADRPVWLGWHDASGRSITAGIYASQWYEVSRPAGEEWQAVFHDDDPPRTYQDGVALFQPVRVELGSVAWLPAAKALCMTHAQFLAVEYNWRGRRYPCSECGRSDDDCSYDPCLAVKANLVLKANRA